jgi:UDP-glucose 4-epimerase
MKILVIGSNGFIGSHCVKFFNANGCVVYKADIKESDEDNYFRLPSANSAFADIFKVTDFDICINASGSANVGFSFESPIIDFELNVLNVQKMLGAIRASNPQCKFINFSSAAVYGNPQRLPIDENAVCKPISPYGFHKWQSELLLTEYHKFFGLRTCSLRVFSAYGPGLKKQLLWDMYQKYQNIDTVKLYGTGRETRDFIYIDDLVQAVNLIINQSDFSGNVYNVANGIETSINEVAEVFHDAIGRDKTYFFSNEYKEGDPNNWVADIASIRNFGYKPQVTIKEGIKKYVEWLKENE